MSTQGTGGTEPTSTLTPVPRSRKRLPQRRLIRGVIVLKNIYPEDSLEKNITYEDLGRPLFSSDNASSQLAAFAVTLFGRRALMETIIRDGEPSDNNPWFVGN